MKLLWLTDTHLDHFTLPEVADIGIQFSEDLEYDAVVITGDVANGAVLSTALEEFADFLDAPVYFVLGNHDFYHSSVEDTTNAARALHWDCEGIFWLDEAPPVQLTSDTVLTGVGGWYDARTGKPDGPGALIMHDWFAIADFNGLESNISIQLGQRGKIIEKAQELADQAAELAEKNLKAAIAMDCEHVLFATHYPPYPAACVHEGKMSEPEWAAWFTSITMGQSIDKVVKDCGKKVTVLCGHTHSPGRYERFDNLTVLTGKAVYGKPCVAGVIEVD